MHINSSRDDPLPKAEEVLKFLSQHSSSGGGLNLFPQQYKKKREIDDKPPIAQLLYKSGQDDVSDFKRAQLQLQKKRRLPIDCLEAKQLEIEEHFSVQKGINNRILKAQYVHPENSENKDLGYYFADATGQ